MNLTYTAGYYKPYYHQLPNGGYHFLLYTATLVVLTEGILKGHFTFSSSPTETHLIIIKIYILHVYVYHKSGAVVTW